MYSLGSSQAMIGESPLMKEIRGYLRQVSVTDSTVLITGETGTGKELATEIIHCNSSRCTKPLVFIDCAALPENLVESELFGYERGAFTGAVTSKPGKFQQANGGTIFLDEIGDMGAYSQAKILRAIESREIQPLGGRANVPLDVRIIAATNQDPEQLVDQGSFRKDLYFRLNVARVHLPPLRHRKEDIPSLLDYYRGKFNKQFKHNVEGFSEEVLSSFVHYDWPGNVRELKNVLEATYISPPPATITWVDLPNSFRKTIEERTGSTPSERDRMVATLISTNWNKSKAATKLQWSRMTLYRKMDKYNVSKEDLGEATEQDPQAEL